ncbi:DUF1795 domain-containing protein [Lampropedia aestuarii]|uniref:DUF1795 domain-containing protein n=1 Tax=Lampropedia aestuarii TaxID=2562762 RepID=A0A4S5BKV5_9BURK|nr:DcrB-related protein [Lampropedia aestuarii]THJ31583.1 DUF1795 domain-containing protein [Lampropedia aestuarii]
MKYIVNEGNFDIPDGLTDKTVNMLMTPDGQHVSYTMTRDKLQEGESLQDFINRQLKELSRQVSKFNELERLETPFANSPQPGWDIKSFFKQNGREFHQRQMVVLLRDERHVFIVTGTAFNAWSDSDLAAWQTMLKHSQLY